MRHERQRRCLPVLTQPGADLRQMPVSADGVRREVGIDAAEMGALGRRLARPADARLGVDHDVDEPQADQRVEGKQSRRRVAAGIGDQPRRADLFAVQLGQTVDAGQQLGTRVLPVPLAVRLEGEPEVGGEIDDQGAVVQQTPGHRSRPAFGKAEERHVDLADLLVVAEGEVGAHARQRL